MKALEKTKRYLAKQYIDNILGFNNSLSKVNALYFKEINNDNPIYSYKASNLYSVGSIVKVMTTLVALDNRVCFDSEVTINKAPLKYSTKDSIYRNVGLCEHDTVLFSDLLVQSMSVSACDSAQAIADFVFPENIFVKNMNVLARKIGLSKSIFKDPVGASSENVMSAKDVYLMTEYLVKKYRVYLDLMIQDYIIFNEKSYKSTSPGFVHSSKYVVKSIKTGYLKSAGRSIIVYIKDKSLSKEYILIVIGASRLIYRDYYIEYLFKKHLDKNFSILL